MVELINNNPRKILIVDDDEDDRSLIAEALNEIDKRFICSTASDGREALNYMLKHLSDLPDIIFLDLQMPRMTGMELIKIIKADPSLMHLSIVICTDSKLARDMDSARKLGSVHFIMKPASFVLLKYELRQVLKEISKPLVS